MTDKELKKLSKSELLELLAYMRKELDSLKEENRRLTEKMNDFCSGEVNREILELTRSNSQKLDMFCSWLLTEDNSRTEQ